MSKIRNTRPMKKINSAGRKLLEGINNSEKPDYQYKLDYLRLYFYHYHSWYNEVWKLWKSGDMASYVYEIDEQYKRFLTLDR